MNLLRHWWVWAAAGAAVEVCWAAWLLLTVWYVRLKRRKVSSPEPGLGESSCGKPDKDGSWPRAA